MAKNLIITDPDNEFGIKEGSGIFLDEVADKLLSAGKAILDSENPVKNSTTAKKAGNQRKKKISSPKKINKS